MKMLERFWFGCGHCDGGASCPFADQMEAAGKTPVTGIARLPIPLTTAAVFLLPLASAILGASLMDKLWTAESALPVSLWQSLGLIVGLAVGAGLAKLALAGMYQIGLYLHRGGE